MSFIRIEGSLGYHKKFEGVFDPNPVEIVVALFRWGNSRVCVLFGWLIIIDSVLDLEFW
jgi:hypothetical protein